MDFTLSPEQQALSKEFEEFFREEEKNAPEGWVGGLEDRYERDDFWAYHLAEAAKMAGKGWLSLPWPGKYGGRDLGPIGQALFKESCAYHRVPGLDFSGLAILAPALLECGTEEQKSRWLPRLANAEGFWCQGWSEPNAGSDLASLTTRATLDGDEWIINGQKIWTTAAHRADHIFVLARTDPNSRRSQGLTTIVTEMDRPGITLRPIYYMNRSHVYNEIFFDNVRVPRENIVGEVNQGWRLTMAGANFERSMSDLLADGRRDFEDLVRFCKESTRAGQPLSANPIVRHRLADLAIDFEAARQWSLFSTWMQSKNPMTFAEPSASKFFITELMVRSSNCGIEIMGLYGTLKAGSKWAPLRGKFEANCQLYLGITIAAGSTEIQKNIIAWMALGLPRK